MKTIINYTINDGIYVLYKDLSREFRQGLCRKYFFTEGKSYGEDKKTVNLVSLVDYCGEKALRFPPNESYFRDCVREVGGVVGEVADLRVLPKIEGLTTSITLRENQEKLYNSLVGCDFNAIVAEKTSFGKTLCSIKFCEILQTSMLFVATKVALIENLLKDCKQFNVDPTLITQVDTAWLSNPKVTPIMYATTQALNNPEILEMLKDKVGLLVGDEIHLGILGESTRNNLYKINSRYNIWLSATYENLKFEGLTQAILSSNILTSEETLDFKIDVHNLNLVAPHSMYDAYYKTQAYGEKKTIVFCNEEYIKAIAEVVAYTIIKGKRGVLVYLENTNGQELIANALRDYNLKVGVLNTNTSKKDTKDILNTFDTYGYDCIVAGASVSAGVSLYRLSCTFDLNITLNKNNLIQLLGRSKRVNKDICNKNKLYIKVTLAKLSDYKWNSDKVHLEDFSYINWNEKISADLVGIEMIKSLKDILI